MTGALQRFLPLIVTTAVYFLGRNRMRASSGGFSSMSGKAAE